MTAEETTVGSANTGAGAEATGATDDATTATLRVVRGEPTAEELAALVAVIARRGGGASEPSPRPKTSAWTDRSRYVRTRLSHSPDGWRASAFPR